MSNKETATTTITILDTEFTIRRRDMKPLEEPNLVDKLMEFAILTLVMLSLLSIAGLLLYIFVLGWL